MRPFAHTVIAMTKASLRTTLGVGLITWLLIDLLRAWTPLLITVFGRAAETPAELIGAFALAVTALPLVALLIAGRRITHSDDIFGATILLAIAARAGVIAPSGRTLLIVASIGVATGLLALALAATRAGPTFTPGLFGGIALATVTHATLGTWGAVWRLDWAGLLVTVVLVLGAGVASRSLRQARDPQPAGRRVGWLALPVLLLAGVALANPARALVAHSLGALVVALAVTVAALLTLHDWSPITRRVAAVGAVAATALVMLPDPLRGWSLLGFAVGMPCLAMTFPRPTAPVDTPPDTPRTPTARAVAAGAVVFTALLFAFHAGYDLGYRADWLLPLIALALGCIALLPQPGAEGNSVDAPRAPHRRGADPGGSLITPLRVLAAVLVVAALTLAGPWATVRPVSQANPPADNTLSVAAYNVRMGYGIDGRFEPQAVAELLVKEHADVILLSEVDRGWLLNGGQDQLTVMARLLGFHAAFGPAADQVWGDAILSRHPLSDLISHRLPDAESLTGAQVLAATITLPNDKHVRVISTHIQPDAGGPEPSLRQARVIRAFAAEQQAAGLPVILGGDFNLEPGGREFDALTREANGQSNLNDALAEARPLLTSSSDDLQKQIDHIFITPALSASRARTVRTLLSDHLPVFVDVTLP